MTIRPLDGVCVIDLSAGIPGAYCTKALADAGAEVIKVEPPEGDPLRRWAIGASLAPGEDGALFQFLACGKRSVVADDVTSARRLITGADVIVWSPGTALAEMPALRPSALLDLAPRAAVVAITPFGLDGPWAGRPATEFTLQAWGGGIWHRGDPDRPPVQVGGRIGEWAAGAIGAIGALLALRQGSGQLVDVSILESVALTHGGMYPVTFRCVAGRPFQSGRRRLLPGIEPTRDGFVGFMVVTGQQWQDFCVLIGKPEWMDDPGLIKSVTRALRAGEVRAAIRSFTLAHTTAEVIEQATMLRVPVAPIGDGATVTQFDHFAERGAYQKNPSGGFLQPSPAYRLSAGEEPRAPEPPPRLSEHQGHVRDLADRPVSADRIEGGDLPLAGLRVADFTMFWAGPIVGGILAMMGAEVIHIESPGRPDGMRFNSAKGPGEDRWWEWGPMFIAGNTNKLGLAVDLRAERGRELALELIRHCDIVLENFSPRVMDSLGLGYDQVSKVRPDAIMVRMPAFGLDGPWRDRTGYAQTQEQVSGMAAITGWPDREPMIPSGPCDPLAGIHATIAVLLALQQRRRTGEGGLVEVPMVGSALNVTAEAVVEYTAYHHLLTRTGNRGPAAAPQNLYRTADLDEEGKLDCWVAIAVETDQEWDALRAAVGMPADPALASAAGRVSEHDRIDEVLAAWCAQRFSDEIVNILWGAGVPVARVVPPHRIDDLEQLRARHYFEDLDHPVVGAARYQGFAARSSRGPLRLHRKPSPTLGQHNRSILGGILGLSPAELDDLEANGIIGDTMPR